MVYYDKYVKCTITYQEEVSLQRSAKKRFKNSFSNFVFQSWQLSSNETKYVSLVLQFHAFFQDLASLLFTRYRWYERNQ